MEINEVILNKINNLISSIVDKLNNKTTIKNDITQTVKNLIHNIEKGKDIEDDIIDIILIIFKELMIRDVNYETVLNAIKNKLENYVEGEIKLGMEVLYLSSFSPLYVFISSLIRQIAVYLLIQKGITISLDKEGYINHCVKMVTECFSLYIIYLYEKNSENINKILKK